MRSSQKALSIALSGGFLLVNCSGGPASPMPGNTTRIASYRIVRTAANANEIYVHNELVVTSTYNDDGTVTHAWAQTSYSARHTVTVAAPRGLRTTILKVKCSASQAALFAAQLQDAENTYDAAIAADILAGVGSIFIDAASLGVAEALGLGAAQVALVAGTIAARNQVGFIRQEMVQAGC